MGALRALTLLSLSYLWCDFSSLCFNELIYGSKVIVIKVYRVSMRIKWQKTRLWTPCVGALHWWAENQSKKSLIFIATVIIPCLDNCIELLRDLISNLLSFQTILSIAVSSFGHISRFSKDVYGSHFHYETSLSVFYRNAFPNYTGKWVCARGYINSAQVTNILEL